MKFLKYFSIVAAALLSFSCQEVDKTYAAPAEEVLNPVLNPHADIVVDENTLSTEVTFTWSEVDYGYPAQVTYSLYVVYNEVEAQLGQSFTTSYTVTKEALNNFLVDVKGLAVPVGDFNEVAFFVTSSISSNSEAYTKRSENITVKVTTIESTAAPWIRDCIYVPGSYQNWAPDAAPVLWETAEDSGKYEGLVNLVDLANPTVDVMFKFTPEPNWEKDFGGSLDNLIVTGSNISIKPGLYWLSVTLKSDGTGGSVVAKRAEAISVIGTAVGGWDLANDLRLAITDNNSQEWSGVIDNCAGGEFKFRLIGGDFESNPWAMSWGGDIDHLTSSPDNLTTTLTGKVKFTINFRGDMASLAEDPTNPSPIFAKVEAAE